MKIQFARNACHGMKQTILYYSYYYFFNKLKKIYNNRMIESYESIHFIKM